MTGKAGFGFQARLGAGFRQVPAMTFRYWQRSIAVEGIAGFDWDVADGQLNDTRRFHGGIGAAWMFHDSKHMSASIGARAYTQLTFREAEAKRVRIHVADSGQTQRLDDLSEQSFRVAVLVSFPLQFEHFLSDHSSITAAVALTITGSSSAFAANEAIDGAFNRPFRELSGATIELAGRYGGGIGYTYYF